MRYRLTSCAVNQIHSNGLTVRLGAVHITLKLETLTSECSTNGLYFIWVSGVSYFYRRRHLVQFGERISRMSKVISVIIGDTLHTTYEYINNKNEDYTQELRTTIKHDVYVLLLFLTGIILYRLCGNE